MLTTPVTWRVRGRDLSLDRPLVMGVVNATPDSFSDGGLYLAPGAALRRAEQLLADGADIIDVGGESTRPQQARPVAVDEELARVVPVIRAIAAARPDAVLSVDTVKAAVAEAALEAGAHIVNDVSALRLDPAMGPVVARAGAGVILMHSRGGVTDMATYIHATYVDDVVDEVERELLAQVTHARSCGIAAECIALDPGIGFAKRPEHSLRVLACLERLVAIGHPVVVGASRKRFIGALTGVTEAADRVHGSVGAALAARARGAAVVRVHDVAATRQALDVMSAIERAGSTPMPRSA